jgi:serine protease Do
VKRLTLAAVLAAALLLAGSGCSRGPTPWLEAGEPSPAAPAAPVSPLPPVPVGGSRIVEVVERVSPAVVNVTSNLATEESLGGTGRQAGEGTGFVVQGEGVVVTNFHVVEGGLNIRVITADGERLEARVIGGDPNADLAVLKVEPQDELPTVALGNSEALRLGEPVVALGFALGLEGGPSVTSGIVSAMDRTITARDPNFSEGERTYEDLIQTDAAINPGNSGGPLVDLSGRVVGINTAGVGAAAAENIGFAIAIDRARPVIEDAIANPEDPVAYMGVSTQDVDEVVAAQFGLPVDSGALVVDVAPGGPADQAGIDPGDVIVGIGGQDVATSADIRELVTERDPGEEVEIQVVGADGAAAGIEVTLGSRPLPIGQG